VFAEVHGIVEIDGAAEISCCAQSGRQIEFWGRENTLDQAKIAVAAQLALTGEHVPRCEIRPFTENEDGGYLISFPDFPGVVASGAMPEEAIRRARDALEVYRSTMRRIEVPGANG
jgi:predicted RNase H-like HicB family nuclease